ncbi:MAG: hypothetical protein DMF88_13005 [Acidobacteria bacterium]|nr:MAG: hypothetical protein DMF88_13005 [Acidobacteriota bacterium]
MFELDPDSGELRKQGLKIRLPDQPLQILLLLLERPGQVVTREALRQRLWPADTFVDFDAGLNSVIKKLRDALGDPAENSRFVETLPRRGYRFIGSLQPPTVLPPEMQEQETRYDEEARDLLNAHRCPPFRSAKCVRSAFTNNVCGPRRTDNSRCWISRAVSGCRSWCGAGAAAARS